MAKLTLTDLASTAAGSILTAVNNNNTAIETAIENTLSRDGTSPNEMNADLDMNSQRIYNLPEATDDTEPVRLGEFSTFIDSMNASIEAMQLLYDSFDDRYLGAKAVAPALDNDGETLLEGALYFDTVTNSFWGWDGNSWEELSGGGGGATTLDDLTDVVITAAASGDYLRYNGSDWVDVPITTLVTDLDSSFLTPTEGNATYQPLDADLTSWAGVTRSAGFDTFAATPSSANLRSLLSDETGTGVAYFQGGDAGTPSALVLTNATGLTSSGVAAATLVTAADTVVANDNDTTWPTTAAIIDYTQPLDADLTAIAALTTTAYGRSLLELADDDALFAEFSDLGTVTWGAGSDFTWTFNGSGAGTNDPSFTFGNGSFVVSVGGDDVFRARHAIVDIRGDSGDSPRIQVGLLTDSVARINFGLDASDTPAFGMGPGDVTARDTFVSRGASAGIVEIGTTHGAIDGTLATATIELGHASDTTLSRVSAGVIAVEGVTILTTATGQPLDADLTSIAALTTTTAGRSVLTVADDALDEYVVWDDSAGTMKTMPLADYTVEASPAAGDFVQIIGAEGDARVVDWSDLPGGFSLPADPGRDALLMWDDSDTGNEDKWTALASVTTEAAPAAGDFVMVLLADDSLAKVDWADLPGAGGGINNVSEDASPTLGGDLEGANFSIGTNASPTGNIFIGSGDKIDFNAGDVTITHSAEVLTLAGGTLVLPAAGLTMGASTPFSDAAGTLTLQNVDALDATTEATVEAAIDTLANLTSVQGLTVTLADAGADAILGWDDSAAAYENLTQGEVRAVAGLATTDSPEFTAINLGHASDTTLTRVSAGVVAIEGSNILTEGTAEAFVESAIDTLANLTSIQGQTVTLADAGANAFFGWDDVAGAYENLTAAEAEAIIEPLIDTLANLTSVQGLTVTLADAGADAIFGWDDSASAYQNLSAADVRTAISGQAQDELLDEIAALSTDPNADSGLFFDDSAGAMAYWTPSNSLEFSGTNLRMTDNARISTITFIIDGGGSAITTGVKGYLEIPFACTITRATALADQSGSIVVDVWKDTYANYPPTDADSITSAAPITISSTTKAQDATLTGWTTSIAAGDILGFNVDSITTCTRVTISLRVTKT